MHGVFGCERPSLTVFGGICSSELSRGRLRGEERRSTGAALDACWKQGLMARPVVLTFVGYYLPGYKAGGPIQSIANLVAHLGDEFDFRIVTRDRDAGDNEPYPGIDAAQWLTVGKAQVCYQSPPDRTLSVIARLIGETPHDVVYLNSFFDRSSSILPLLARKLGLVPRRPVILAPRGEFSSGALGFESIKKRAFMAATRAVGLHRDVLWHASSEHEAADIRTVFGSAASIHVASDLPRAVPERPIHTPRTADQPLRVLFLSRISPMKNLTFALDVLERVEAPVVLSIIGPINNETAYWAECQTRIAKLPSHITVSYDGVVPAMEVPAAMAKNDLFFLPTLGENFGHVIIEALGAGTPALISDQTPWRDLDRAGCGWVEPLGDPQVFADHIDALFRERPDVVAARRVAASDYARRFAADSGVVEDNRRLFDRMAPRC